MTAEQAAAAAPVMLNGEPNPTGTGRYCPPAVCYCGKCPWWVPIPDPPRPPVPTGKRRRSWDARDGSTWIDEL